jgi:hypothetical protein
MARTLAALVLLEVTSNSALLASCLNVPVKSHQPAANQTLAGTAAKQ